jgi:hypothetical protein
MLIIYINLHWEQGQDANDLELFGQEMDPTIGCNL